MRGGKAPPFTLGPTRPPFALSQSKGAVHPSTLLRTNGCAGEGPPFILRRCSGRTDARGKAPPFTLGPTRRPFTLSLSKGAVHPSTLLRTNGCAGEGPPVHPGPHTPPVRPEPVEGPPFILRRCSGRTDARGKAPLFTLIPPTPFTLSLSKGATRPPFALSLSKGRPFILRRCSGRTDARGEGPPVHPGIPTRNPFTLSLSKGRHHTPPVRPEPTPVEGPPFILRRCSGRTDARGKPPTPPFTLGPTRSPWPTPTRSP